MTDQEPGWHTTSELGIQAALNPISFRIPTSSYLLREPQHRAAATRGVIGVREHQFPARRSSTISIIADKYSLMVVAL